MGRDNTRGSHTETDGTIWWYGLESKVLYLPYHLEEKDYTSTMKGFISKGFTVQLEIV